MTDSWPKIGVVIIGINVESFIADCIHSIFASDYPAAQLSVVYVDGGSRDNSVLIASNIKGVDVIELKDPSPTPGRGRNAGWQTLTAPYIQFLDADTILDPDWFKTALSRIKDKTAAVCGFRKERYPKKNIYHRITEKEWHYEKGPCRYFGGDVLILRSVLEETNGFDGDLIAGEDPELSYRVRQNGWEIFRMDTKMTTHDINMSTLKQYLKRAYRSGYAYAEISLRFLWKKERMWLRELLRITLKSLLFLSIILFGIIRGWPVLGVAAAFLMLLIPHIRNLRKKAAVQKIALFDYIYTAHALLVIFPQFFGILRYLAGKVFDAPLKNKGYDETLKT